MLTVAVVGSRKSGKTTAIESLVRGLTKRGYRVATVKHVPKAEFTIDTVGKDTWRHAKAGARIVVSVSPNEFAAIKRVDTRKYCLPDIIGDLEDNVDVVVLEGFRELTEQNLDVPKIVAAKTSNEVLEASGRFKPLLTFVGPVSNGATKLKVPYVDVLKEPEKLVDLVEKKLSVQIKERQKDKGKLRIQADDHVLPLNPFVKKIIRSTVLAMVSTLRGVSIRGDENISIMIESASKN